MPLRKLPSLVLAALALTSTFALGKPPAVHGDNGPELSADIPLRLSPLDATAATRSAKAGPTEADVGDVDSFGRNLRWLGVAAMSVELTNDCTGADPAGGCQVLSPAPAVTHFNFEDLGHIALPEKATNSMLCRLA